MISSVLPQFTARHSAVAVHPLSPIIFVALTDNTFWLYDISKKTVTEWSAKYSEGGIPSRLLKSPDKIIGIAFDPAPDNSSSVVLYGHSFLFHIDFKVLQIFPLHYLPIFPLSFPFILANHSHRPISILIIALILTLVRILTKSKIDSLYFQSLMLTFRSL